LAGEIECQPPRHCKQQGKKNAVVNNREKTMLPSTIEASNSDGGSTAIQFIRTIVMPDGQRWVEGVTPKQIAPPSSHALPNDVVPIEDLKEIKDLDDKQWGAAMDLPTTLQASESDGGPPTIQFIRTIVMPDGQKWVEGVTPKQIAPPSSHALPNDVPMIGDTKDIKDLDG
jgi:hypothetical protein